MSENTISRRTFLVAGAGAATAVAGVGGYVGYRAWVAHEPETKSEDTWAWTMCNACSNKCSYKAYVHNGVLGKLIASEDYPKAKGSICTRGYGYANIAYSPDRLTDPLKKNAEGEFEVITWDQAFSEIGEKVKAILAEHGPEAISIVQDPRPSGSYYSKRFMHALGSPNVYTHGAACNNSKEGAFEHVFGKTNFSADVANAKVVMFLGRSVADAIRPAAVKALQKAHEKGAHVIMVDPRCNNSVLFADEWLPINPGTDMAFLLALCNVLITEDLYDHAFIEKYAEGFETFVETNKPYTPEWAAEITGISAEDIVRIAHLFAEAAPAAVIEESWRAVIGCQYANSGETARVLALFNTLLGNWNQEGGARLTPSLKVGDLDPVKFPEVPKPEIKRVGDDVFPLGCSKMGINIYAAQQALEGNMKAMFFYNSNMVGGYSNPTHLAKCLDALDLCVAIDVQMSETCLCADYVLPDTSFLERMEIPQFDGGGTPCITLRDKVLEKVHPNTLPCEEIFGGLAEACGVGEYFQFTVEELAEAQLATAGVTLAELREKGCILFKDKKFVPGTEPEFKTESGKVMFADPLFEECGYTAAPSWVAPKVMPKWNNEFRLIDGKQSHMSHTMTANIEHLMSITQDYDLDRVWINAQRAELLGLKDGDEVELSNDQFTDTCRIKVTQRINPTTLFMPGHYGISSKDQHTAYGVGARNADFMEFDFEKGYGSTMTHEIIVTLKKVGK